MDEMVHIFRLRMTPEINLAVEQLLLERKRISPRAGKNEVLLDLLAASLRDGGVMPAKKGRKNKPELKLRRVSRC
jgi:hypothetical protein